MILNVPDCPPSSELTPYSSPTLESFSTFLGGSHAGPSLLVVPVIRGTTGCSAYSEEPLDALKTCLELATIATLGLYSLSNCGKNGFFELVWLVCKWLSFFRVLNISVGTAKCKVTTTVLSGRHLELLK